MAILRRLIYFPDKEMDTVKRRRTTEIQQTKKKKKKNVYTGWRMGEKMRNRSVFNKVRAALSNHNASFICAI